MISEIKITIDRSSRGKDHVSIIGGKFYFPILYKNMEISECVI